MPDVTQNKQTKQFSAIFVKVLQLLRYFVVYTYVAAYSQILSPKMFCSPFCVYSHGCSFLLSKKHLAASGWGLHESYESLIVIMLDPDFHVSAGSRASYPSQLGHIPLAYPVLYPDPSKNRSVVSV